ncbi:hypothetical protein WJX73_008090 [Symbiochloris irregularis]|uniref:Uncharacterized protein n=1 Tax=Symbiochloris irregularis TaxID=706552 RepID=A0AAW1NWJ3_9CHLO
MIAASIGGAFAQPIGRTTSNDLAGFAGTALAPYAAALSQAAPPLQERLSDDPLFSEAKADPPLGATDPYLNAFLNDPVLLDGLRTSNTFDELLAALPPAKAATLLELNLAPATGDAAADEETIQKILAEPPVSSGSRKLLQT